jgi:hypothetical protein
MPILAHDLARGGANLQPKTPAVPQAVRVVVIGAELGKRLEPEEQESAKDAESTEH